MNQRTFTCSQTQSEKRAVCPKQVQHSIPWSTGRYYCVYPLCLLPLPHCPHKFGLTVQVNFSFTESSGKTLTLFSGDRFCWLAALPSLSKELSFPSNFMLESVKSRHLLQARDAKNSAFCWADPTPSISSLPKQENIVPCVTFQYGTLKDTPLIFVLFCLFFFVIEANYNEENGPRNLLLIYFTLLGEHAVSQRKVPSFLSARSHLCSYLPLSRSFD